MVRAAPFFVAQIPVSELFTGSRWNSLLPVFSPEAGAPQRCQVFGVARRRTPASGTAGNGYPFFLRTNDSFPLPSGAGHPDRDCGPGPARLQRSRRPVLLPLFSLLWLPGTVVPSLFLLLLSLCCIFFVRPLVKFGGSVPLMKVSRVGLDPMGDDEDVRILLLEGEEEEEEEEEEEDEDEGIDEGASRDGEVAGIA